MNYFIQGDAAKADKIRAAFEKLGIDTLNYNFKCNGMMYFSWNGKVKSIDIDTDFFKTRPDYKELELPGEPKFKAEDRIVSKSDKSTIYRIITLHDERREYIVEIEHKNFHESCPWIAFEDQDDYELVPKPHYDISNFQPFDKVLVRFCDGANWCCALFSHYCTRGNCHFVCSVGSVTQFIPFNDDTKHLLGTTGMPSEEFINW